MIKKIFPFITILTLALFLGACNSEDVMPEIGSETNPELTERTISFTASMPGEDDPATRVSAAEEADRAITLTWDANDKLDLLFVQGDNKFHESTTVTNIENGGKNATFTVPLPDGITDGTPYNLYGVYGGGAVSTTNPALIGLPAIEGTTLNEENVGKKVMLRFAKENLNLNDAVGAVNFEHVGFLFTAKIKVTAGSVDDITSVQLVGADAGNETWAYNASANHLDMETGTFTAEGTRGNTVNFQNSEKDATNNILTVRNWLPETETAWPALKLSINGTNETANAKPSRTPEVGKAYYLYATWNGTDLVFVDKDFNEPVAGTKIDIADLRAAFVQGESYAEDHYIEGEVILNPYQENTPDFVVYVADYTAGITLTINDKENLMAKLPLGAKVRINVQTSEWNKYNGLIQLGLSTDNVEIIEETSSTPLVPRVVTIQDVLDGNYQSELVQVNNVQFKDIPATYNYGQTLTNVEGEEATVFTRSQATFADTGVIEGNGPFIGVVSYHTTGAQLLIRSLDDLAGMTGPRYVPPFINVNPFSLTFEKEAGNETISVTANVAWTASSDADWLTIDPASGTNNGTITVTATENGVDARNATITITDGTITKTVSVTQKGEETSGGPFAETLFFSEYIEGGGHNKFLEIYNGTGETVDLSDYKVETYMNGDATTDKVLELTGTLEHGKVLVIYNSQASINPVTTNAIVDNNIANFNGNDAVALMKTSGEYVDIIGHIGESVNWSQDGNSTKDNTLVRKPGIKKGVTSSTAGFPELGTEWIGYPKDTGDYIGSHTTDY